MATMSTDILRSRNESTSLLDSSSGSWAVIGNPDDRRVAFFQRALESHGLPAATLVSWLALLDCDSLPELLTGDQLIRIESPGENRVVEQRLIDDGAKLQGAKTGWALQRGEIGNGSWWYSGFRRQLDRLASRCPAARWMNHPDDIACLFDKPRCKALLRQLGVPVPADLGVIGGYDELRRCIAEYGLGRVFLKPPYGSSSSGVIALQTRRRPSHRVQAQTSVELTTENGQARLFNSLKIRTYSSEREVAELVDALGQAGGLMVEPWIPKAGFDNRTVDVRVVVIARRLRHRVLRSSRSPLTNLHLGNQRGDIDRFWQNLPARLRQQIDESCRQIAKAFPRSLYFGIDVLVAPNLRQHTILEVNAFGDLLPGLVDEGEDTYAAEVAAIV